MSPAARPLDEYEARMMIELTFYNWDRKPSTKLRLTDLRVTGGVLWNSLEYGLLAHYSEGQWIHRGQAYPVISVGSGGCLVFGITRAPTLLSEPVGWYSFTGSTFRANGIGVADFIEEQDMWRGLLRPIWWTTMRVVAPEAISAVVDMSHVKILNPWDSPHKGGTRSSRRLN
jgi:hypothetical protein